MMLIMLLVHDAYNDFDPFINQSINAQVTNQIPNYQLKLKLL